jgi:hypothetical protein
MQEQFAVFFGVMLIGAALTAAHPIRPQTVAIIGEHFAANWQAMETHAASCPTGLLDACQPQLAVP